MEAELEETASCIDENGDMLRTSTPSTSHTTPSHPPELIASGWTMILPHKIGKENSSILTLNGGLRGLEEMPVEILFALFHRCNVQTLSRLMRCSTVLRNVILDESFSRAYFDSALETLTSIASPQCAVFNMSSREVLEKILRWEGRINSKSFANKLFQPKIEQYLKVIIDLMKTSRGLTSKLRSSYSVEDVLFQLSERIEAAKQSEMLEHGVLHFVVRILSHYDDLKISDATAILYVQHLHKLLQYIRDGKLLRFEFQCLGAIRALRGINSTDYALTEKIVGFLVDFLSISESSLSPNFIRYSQIFPLKRGRTILDSTLSPFCTACNSAEFVPWMLALADRLLAQQIRDERLQKMQFSILQILHSVITNEFAHCVVSCNSDAFLAYLDEIYSIYSKESHFSRLYFEILYVYRNSDTFIRHYRSQIPELLDDVKTLVVEKEKSLESAVFVAACLALSSLSLRADYRVLAKTIVYTLYTEIALGRIAVSYFDALVSLGKTDESFDRLFFSELLLTLSYPGIQHSFSGVQFFIDALMGSLDFVSQASVDASDSDRCLVLDNALDTLGLLVSIPSRWQEFDSIMRQNQNQLVDHSTVTLLLDSLAKACSRFPNPERLRWKSWAVEGMLRDSFADRSLFSRTPLLKEYCSLLHNSSVTLQNALCVHNVNHGSWYFRVELISVPTTLFLGFATALDDKNTSNIRRADVYLLNVSEKEIFSAKESYNFGVGLKNGDRITAIIDLDERKVTFVLNEAPIPVVLDIPHSTRFVSPALILGPDTKVEVDFGVQKSLSTVLRPFLEKIDEDRRMSQSHLLSMINQLSKIISSQEQRIAELEEKR